MWSRITFRCVIRIKCLLIKREVIGTYKLFFLVWLMRRLGDFIAVFILYSSSSLHISLYISHPSTEKNQRIQLGWPIKVIFFYWSFEILARILLRQSSASLSLVASLVLPQEPPWRSLLWDLCRFPRLYASFPRVRDVIALEFLESCPTDVTSEPYRCTSTGENPRGE